MKESYVEGSSAPPRPRVMAACPQGHVASVDRGTRRPAIEPCLPAGRSVITPSPGAPGPTSYGGREGNRMRGANASRDIRPAESETLSPGAPGRESSVPENREIPAAPAAGRKPWKGRSGKACGHNPDVYAAGKSDRPIVPRKLPNKPGTAASGAEEAEGRGLAKEKTLRQNPPTGHSANPGWSNAAKRIRQAQTPVRPIQGRSRMR